MHLRRSYGGLKMANKNSSEKNKPARRKLQSNEFYNLKTKRYEYHYKDYTGKERVISSYRIEKKINYPKVKNYLKVCVKGKLN